MADKEGLKYNPYRCKQGTHFTDKEHDGKECPYDNMSASDLSNDIKIDINNKAIENLSGKYLTRQELAIWSEKLAKSLNGGYVKELSSGEKVIGTKNKAVFSKGTFEKPIITKIIEFDDKLELMIFMEIL